MDLAAGPEPESHVTPNSQPPSTRRPLLGRRDDGIERLIKGSPAENAPDLNALRAWARNTTREVSRWQIERACNRNRLGQGGRP